MGQLTSPPDVAKRKPERSDGADGVEHRPEMTELFERYERHVRRVLFGMLGPDAELSDLVQDVFVAALGSVRGLREPAALKRLLSTITVYRARARMRERNRARQLDPLPDEEVEQLGIVLPEPELDEALRTTERILATLPADERRAIELRFVHELELTDVARVFGVSLSTIKRRMNRATHRFDRLARQEPAVSEWRGGDRRFKKRPIAEA
jgi:RNA polymerase sigma-70 factor (ECF subfamily)